MKVVYLASYPKSGNTWLRFLLHAAIYGDPRTSHDVAQRIPDSHVPNVKPFPPQDIGSELAPGPMMFVKTHALPSTLLPMWSQAAAAICIIRNPRDIMRSALHYRQLTTEPVATDAYVRTFLQYAGDPDWLLRGFGTFAQHTLGWRNCGRPVHFIRYEDLKTNTVATLQTVIDFLRLKNPPTATALAHAAKVASFQNMREMEVREKHGGKNTLFVGSAERAKQGMFFVNKGTVSTSLDDIGPGLEAAFCRQFGPYLDASGYHTPAAEPAAPTA